MNNDFPIFLHIPKNGGTYVLNAMRKCSRSMYLIQGKDGKRIATVFSKTTVPLNENFIKTEWSSIYKVNSEYLFKNLANLNIKIHSAIIHSRGFRQMESLVRQMEGGSQNCSGIFLTLRNPFERTRSLFNYLKSRQSKHEETFLKSDLFDEYISSGESENCWLMRELLNMDNLEELTDSKYLSLCDMLNKMTVFSLKKIDILIELMLGIKINSLQLNHRHQNVGPDLNLIEFNNLKDGVKKIFIDKNKYDISLYEKYC